MDHGVKKDQDKCSFFFTPGVEPLSKVNDSQDLRLLICVLMLTISVVIR